MTIVMARNRRTGRRGFALKVAGRDRYVLVPLLALDNIRKSA